MKISIFLISSSYSIHFPDLQFIQYPFGFQIIKFFELFSHVKNPMDVVNFMNNLQSIFDDLVKKHKCFKHEKRTEYMVETGASAEV